MATQHTGNGESSRLLALPREVRDMILAFTMLDFPDLSLDDMVGRAKEVSDELSPEDGRPFNDESSDGSESEEDDLWASDPVDYVLNGFFDTHQIDTNIFLTCHQIFDEAKDVFMRQGRLVSVNASNVFDLALRLYNSQICVIDNKYRHLCILKYDIRNPSGWNGRSEHEFVICARDVENFCRAIMGDTPLLLRPKLTRDTYHTLAFTTNFHKKGEAPNFLLTQKNHEKALEPFRKHLRGFPTFSVRGRCVRLNGAFAFAAAAEIRSNVVPDPDGTIRGIHEMEALGRKWKGEKSIEDAVVPIEKAMNLCRRAGRLGSMWAAVQPQDSASRAFSEEVLPIAYRLLAFQAQAYALPLHEMGRSHHDEAARASESLDPFPSRPVSLIKAYERSLAAGKWYGIPGWIPHPEMEALMNRAISAGLLTYRDRGTSGNTIAIGYKAAQRALDLQPEDETANTRMRMYREWKQSAVQRGQIVEIRDDDLEESGVDSWATPLA